MDKKYQHTNRLISEKSPYLQQHAHNPVDWYPWGDEAFSAAKLQDKPIFLSIGYATCHWCHQMEQESFDKEEIAELLNTTFINVKIDREELPEVDNLYMEFAQSLMSGAVGWPLNLILTPNLQPFFAATYLPPYSQQGMVGLREMIHRIQEIWKGEERERVLEQAEKIVEIFRDSAHSQGEVLPSKLLIDQALDLLYQLADPIFGGMKGAPKFPIGYQSNFLIRYGMLHNESRALFLVEKTLDMMHRGGIYDHLGGGFSRYSTDEEWLIPHFEKMLYDNAILAYAYLEAWQATRKETYREVVQEILDYVLRDMTSREGAFFSAEDSDSEGKEGYFYTWTMEDIEETIGREDAVLFHDFYDILPQGNFEGRNILNTPLSREEFAKQRGIDPDYLRGLLDRMKKQLWEKRNSRPHPFKDDKTLTSWNALMIHALVEAGSAFQEPRYIEAAEKATKFIHNNLWHEGILYHRWRDGEHSFRGGIDDYACMIRALLSLFEADCGTQWLKWAIHLASILNEHLKAPQGAYFQTDGNDENLLLRRCPYSDGAEPSGNAIHGENLLRLYQLTFQETYHSDAEDIFRAVQKYMDTYALGFVYHLMNLQRYSDEKAPTIVIALNRKAEWKDQIQREIFGTLIPHRAVIWRREEDEELVKLLPWLKTYVPVESKTTMYVCHRGACEEPLTELKEIIDTIHRL